LGADFAAFPVSSSDAVTQYLDAQSVAWEQTRIGSPYVISAMKAGAGRGKQRVVGWEVNGGFLTGVELEVNGAKLASLPTRDAAVAIIGALVTAARAGKAVSQVFAELPRRFTQAGLIDDFPVAVSKTIVKRFGEDTEAVRAELREYFTEKDGFGAVTGLNFVDGVRIMFANGDVAHLRPSGNAPQFRVYSVAGSQKRADEIVALAVREPDGIFRRMERALSAG
jgi:phosphomannomutase